MSQLMKKDRTLTLGLGSSGWGPLYPAHQSSLYGAIIISHVFDSLIGVDNTGGFVPNLAKTWDINDDRTIYTFIIDTERRFSDGTKLTAEIYKDSLLHSLKLDAAASNRSALDVLYALKGFSDYKSTGDIEGLEVIGDNILKMHFQKPYRRAIDQLSGTRYGAYILKNDQYLGTGPYIYENIRNDEVELGLNSYYPYPVSIKHVRIVADGPTALYKGKIDVVFTPPSAMQINNVKPNIKREKMSSLLAIHSIIVVNGMRGRLFSNGKLRKAAQYIVIKDYMNQQLDDRLDPFFIRSAQFYQPLFVGHLEDSEVNEIIDDGKKYVNLLIEESKRMPIVCITRPSSNGYNYCDALRKGGVEIEERKLLFSEVKEVLYKNYDADLVGYGVSYATADPDGLYHYLGKNGAIWSPMSSRHEVEDLIEAGRSIISADVLDNHYRKVARAILDEVPAIHLGSQNVYLEYNSDLVQPTDKLPAKRKALNMTLFQWR